MDQPDHEAEAQFTKPWGQFLLMVAVLGFTAAGTALVYGQLEQVIMANPPLNGFILLVFLIGVLACFWQLVQINRSTSWITGFTGGRTPGEEEFTPPRLLAPLAALLRSRGARMQISSTSQRSILDSVATRIDELRDITRYIVNLLIFLGLLGTFYGLATTVPAVVDTIRSLAPQEGEEGISVFNRLMTGLEAQLGGMGVAFGSSLLGLAGSLVVGLLELLAGHSQNRFYRELEEWLSTITRLGFSSGDGDGGGSQDAVVAVMDHMSQQMEALQALFAGTDAGRAEVDARLGDLAGSIEKLAARMDRDDDSADALGRIAEGQTRLVQVLENQANLGAGGGIDAESRMRLRSIDVQLLRILEEMAAGRQESTADLRADIATLTHVIRRATRDAETEAERG